MPYVDPAAKRANDAAYKAARRADLAAKQRAYYQRTRAERDASSSRYLAEHPETERAVRFANGSNQRARRWNVEGKLYGRDVIRLTGPCVYCGADDRDSWDHVIPLSRGGANAVSNLVPCCRDCNRRKADQPLAVWRRVGASS